MISSFLCPNLQRTITRKNFFFNFFSRLRSHYPLSAIKRGITRQREIIKTFFTLLTILYQQTKSEATSFNSFSKHPYYKFLMTKFAFGQSLEKNVKGKNLKILFLIKKKSPGIYSLSSIRCQSLKLLAVIVFDISSFLCANMQRAITRKNKIK